MVYWGGVAKSLFVGIVSAWCRRFGLVVVVALCSCRYLMGIESSFEVDRVRPGYDHCRGALVGLRRVTLSSFGRFLFLVRDVR